VEIENPLAAEESILRPSLLPGLLRAVAANAGHRRPDVGLFEIGHVFLPPAEGEQLPDEPERLAVALGERDAPDAVRIWRVLTDGLRLVDVTLEAAQLPGLHPTRSARVMAGGRTVGSIGEVDPGVLAAHDIEGRVGWFEVDLGALLTSPRRPAVYRPVSRFPSADIDLAFVVEEGVPAAAVERTLAEAAGELLERIELFDVFRSPQLEGPSGPLSGGQGPSGPLSGGQGPSGPLSGGQGARSLAWRLRFSSLDHTLTEDELTALRLRCIDAVTSTHPARLRG
jgi:phenylalanyl-tRNA synthetase beta chain